MKVKTMDIASRYLELKAAGELRGRIKRKQPMSELTSLGIGGPVEVMVRPADMESLALVLDISARAELGVLPLGAGTNILVGDSPHRLLALSLREFKEVRVSASERMIEAGAGTNLSRLLEEARKAGLSGLEGLSGIPGTLGGAVAGNAGSYGSEMSAVVQSVEVLDIRGGSLRRLESSEIEFKYRRAVLPLEGVIVGATLSLSSGEPGEIAARMSEFMKRKKASQPVSERSAGCVFKNPEGQSAGRLIEEAGCKGMREGAIEVSELHANFFINTGGRGRGRARDFLRLMERVQESVQKHYGISLDPEIRMIGC